MKVRDVIKRLEADGWIMDRMRGDHRQYKKANEPNVVTVSGHPADEVTPGQLQDIRRKSRLPLR
jgi:predicted RNA binding protein YcfA (HicA-like mRNA interferase family)